MAGRRRKAPAIRTARDYRAAIKRVRGLMGAKSSARVVRLKRLAGRIQDYETRKYGPI